MRREKAWNSLSQWVCTPFITCGRRAVAEGATLRRCVEPLFPSRPLQLGRRTRLLPSLQRIPTSCCATTTKTPLSQGLLLRAQKLLLLLIIPPSPFSLQVSFHAVGFFFSILFLRLPSRVLFFFPPLPQPSNICCYVCADWAVMVQSSTSWHWVHSRGKCPHAEAQGHRMETPWQQQQQQQQTQRGRKVPRVSNGAKEAKNSDPQALAGQTDRFIFLSYYILLLLLRHIIICFCKKMKKKKKSLRWMSFFERERASTRAARASSTWTTAR